VVTGQATAEGTSRYATRLGQRVHREHFRTMPPDLRISSIGLGTYLGAEDDATDVLYRRAITAAVERGINLFDTAVNYRHQRSERVIGAALQAAINRGLCARDEVIVATKGGFIALDAADPRDPRAYFSDTYLQTGLVSPDDVVAGSHCMSPRFLEDQIERSRKNLGLETIDIYYVHNPETQIDEVDRAEFGSRIREAFSALEDAVTAGKIARYGTATWNGYLVDAGQRGHLSLAEMVAAARDAGGPDHHFSVVQVPYNLGMHQAFTRATQVVGDQTMSLLAAAERLGVYVMASASVHQGQLTRGLPEDLHAFLPGLETDAQRALQFVRSTPGVGSALVGMKTVAHVEENSAVGRTTPLAWEQFKRMFSES
jgi:aryl-alcohol dehydrogenase-like predicted oxidoreductase